MKRGAEGSRMAAVAAAPPVRIALFGLFGCGNLGNDGSFAAMLETLRRVCPEAEITCICANPEEVERLYGVRALRFGLQGEASAAWQRIIPDKLGNWLRVLRYRGYFDVLIFPGTGILDDFGAGPWGMPLCILGWCFASRLGGAKIAFVSIGAGPIHHPISRKLMKWGARLAHYRSYRDVVSREFMDGIGLDVSRDPVFPDLAFALPVPAVPAQAPDGGPPVIGLGVMSYFGWSHDPATGGAIYRTYLEKLASFAAWLLGGGYRIRVLMSDLADATAARDLRLALAAELRELPVEAFVAEAAFSLGDVMRQAAATELVVATRFHTVVCALMLGKPVISLGYSSKNDALLAEMGLGEYCQHVERFDVPLLIDQFIALQRDRGRRQRKIRDTALLYRERLKRQEQALVGNLLPAPRRLGAATARAPRLRPLL